MSCEYFSTHLKGDSPSIVTASFKNQQFARMTRLATKAQPRFSFRLPARALLPFEIFVSCAVCTIALNTTSLSRRLCQRHEATLPVLLARPLARAGLWPRAPGSSPPSTWWRAVHFCPRPGRLSDLPREAALLMPKRALRMHLKQRFLSQAGNLQMAPLLTLNVPRGTLLAFSENALITSDCTGHKTFIFLLIY